MADSRNPDFVEFYEEDLGDGMTQCGDIYCHYPIISVEETDTYTKFEYDNFFVIVEYDTFIDIEGNNTKRVFKSWRREYLS